MITYDIIKDFCEKNNISADENSIERFEDITLMLKEFNSHTNVTALKTDTDIAVKHYADSLSPLAFGLIPNGASVIDVGCGAGFPGLPLKNVREDIKITFLDSTAKKLKFPQSVSDKYNFNADFLPMRAEDAAKESYRESYDIAVSRAVSTLPVLCELCLPFVKVGGSFIAYKSVKEADASNSESELSLSSNAIKQLGGTLSDIKYITLPPCNGAEGQKNAVIVIKKIKKCSTIYPRRYAQILKKPL